MRYILQPVLYVGMAAVLHGLLFFIPSAGPAKRDAGTTRGIRVKAFVESAPAKAPPSSPASPPMPVSPRETPLPPRADQETNYSASGSKTGTGESAKIGVSGQGASGGGEGTPSRGKFEEFVAGLGDAKTQGWAQNAAKASRGAYRESGRGGASGGGWGKGSTTGDGTGGASGKGTGGGGARYMDPRVRMVVSSYPQTGIERKYTVVRYPDLKIKKSDYTSGWWNVYIEIRTDRNGKVTKYQILRPETDGPLERQFVAQVKKEIEKWTFDPVEAEVHVDVRFYVE